ncbi:hypothetical protein GQ457_12G018510 [Hibiscus cannabinus]
MIPLEQNMLLTTIEYDAKLQNSRDDDLFEDKRKFQRLIGQLLYLTHIRPEITHAIQYLSQFMQDPKVTHMEEASRIVRYLKTSPGRGVLLIK